MIAAEEEQKLYEAILCIESVDECRRFFEDLCTPSEIEEFSSRWLIARLLNEKKPYRQIASETGVSTTTVGRVARYVRHGSNGYNVILGRQAKKSNFEQKKKGI